jgi:hypothetical protein
MKTDETLTSTCDNVYDVAGGRKTNDTDAIEILAGGGSEGGDVDEVAVLVSVGEDDVVAFSYEVESVPSLEPEDDDDDDEEEEWESDEEEDDEGECTIICCWRFCLTCHVSGCPFRLFS